MRSEESESGPDSPGTDAATAGSRSGAGSPPPTTHDGSPQCSPGGMDRCVFSETVGFELLILKNDLSSGQILI